MSTKQPNRRSFIKLTASAIAAGPAILLSQSSFAEEAVAAEQLAESDPLAMALGYKVASTEVDATTYPNHNAEQICNGCTLYIGEDPEWGACSAFQNKLVAGGGWCAAFAAKPS